MLYKNILLFTVLLSIILGRSIAEIANATIITSLKPLGFIAAAITDGVTSTQVLLPDNASEHDYSLRLSDIKHLQNAKLVIWIGPTMEVFMSRSINQLAKKKQIQIAMLESVKMLIMKGKGSNKCIHDYYCDNKNIDNNHHDCMYNMYLWLSPEIAWLSAIAIHDKLVELMPQNRAKLDANLKDFELKLIATNKQISYKLASFKEKKYYVINNIYQYYEKYYGLMPLGYFTINHRIQPGVQSLHKIRTQLIEQKVTCIFTDLQFKPAILGSITRGTPVHIGTLDPFGTNIQLNKQSYVDFLDQLANQYASCLIKH